MKLDSGRTVGGTRGYYSFTTNMTDGVIDFWRQDECSQGSP